MKQKLFTEWLQNKVNEGSDFGQRYQQYHYGNNGNQVQQKQEPDLYSARESIKNAMANMRSDPTKVLADGLQWGLKKAAGHPQATQIIRRMQDMAMQFFQEIRDKNLGIYDNRQGNVIRPRMPSQGERGFEEYQQIYLAYYDKLHRIWQGLDQLAHQ